MHSNQKSVGREYSHLAAGNVAESWEMSDSGLTLEVERAAKTLSISRAFAYDGVARGEIPRVPSGRLGVAAEGALSMWSSRSGLGSCASRAGRSRGW